MGVGIVASRILLAPQSLELLGGLLRLVLFRLELLSDAIEAGVALGVGLQLTHSLDESDPLRFYAALLGRVPVRWIPYLCALELAPAFPGSVQLGPSVGALVSQQVQAADLAFGRFCSFGSLLPGSLGLRPLVLPLQSLPAQLGLLGLQLLAKLRQLVVQPGLKMTQALLT